MPQHSHHNHSSHHHHDAAGNIAVVFLINSVFAVVELVGGLLTNSVAILSDALHDFGDSLSLGMAWFFEKKSKRGRSDSYTYGYKRFSLIGAFVNSVVLIIGSIFIIRESIQRLFAPEDADARGMLLLAILGIAVNGAAMLRLRRGDSINERVVSLHFLEDILGWVAVLVGSIIMMFTRIPYVDPVLSLIISSFILFNVYRNIRPAIQIVLQGVPQQVSPDQVRDILHTEPMIIGFHDYHLWTLDGRNHVISMHVVVRENMDLKAAETLKEDIKQKLVSVGISHATIEVEFDPQHCGKVE